MKKCGITEARKERDSRTEGVNTLKYKGTNRYLVCKLQDFKLGKSTVKQLCSIKQFTIKKEAISFWETIKNN